MLAAGPFPLAAVFASFLIAAASVGWALSGGWRAWGRAMGPGMIAVAAVVPEGLASYLASAVAGPIVREALRRGGTAWSAGVWGVAPAVVWTVGVALSGFQPIPAEIGPSLDALFEDAASRGDLPAESLAELRESSKTALEVMRRTWVGSEAVWLWASLALGYAWVRRMIGRGWPAFGPFARLDLPDGFVWAFIVGLTALLLRRDGALGIMGANLVCVTGFAFTLRGFAIETFWMNRARLGRLSRFALFGGGVVLFLPVFLLVAAGLGLFDTWFDFRRVREAEPGSHPFSFMGRSSGDDANEKE